MNDITRNQIIATNIKRYIKENKITQKELAEAIGISPSTMSDYMNLRSNPSHGVIQKIADFFGILKSDIDTTYKETNDISNIYNQLNTARQKIVYEIAEQQLEEQNKVVALKKSDSINNKENDIYLINLIDEEGSFGNHRVAEDSTTVYETSTSQEKKLEVIAAHIDENTTEEEMDEITAFIDSLRDE